MSRNGLPEAEEKYLTWRRWQSRWRWTQALIGCVSATCGAVAAFSVKQGGLHPNWVFGIAVASPVLATLLTGLRPGENAKAFSEAAHILEKAITRFKLDPTADDKLLSKAIADGIDKLND